MSDSQSITIGKRLKAYFEEQSISQSTIAERLGVSQPAISALLNGKPFGKSTAKKWSEQFGLKPNWLLTGEGEMLKGGDNTIAAASINYEGKGVPYYDVDFIGGFDLVFNDQTTRPAYYINFPGYDSADCWINVTGHSMEPEVSHGDIVAVKELKDWRTHILYGEMYAIVTEENRTIKYIRRSEEGKDWLRLVPVNKAEYDEQDIPKDVINKVFKVLGSAKRFQ